MFNILVFLHGRLLGALDHWLRWASPRCRGSRGQTTAEYALVLLGAAAIAMLVVTWATKSGAIGKLFDAVISHVIGAVT
jgi:hypothetical protein